MATRKYNLRSSANARRDTLPNTPYTRRRSLGAAMNTETPVATPSTRRRWPAEISSTAPRNGQSSHSRTGRRVSLPLADNSSLEDEPTCIDLTNDIEELFIDLTDIGDTPTFVGGSRLSRSSVARRRDENLHTVSVVMENMVIVEETVQNVTLSNCEYGANEIGPADNNRFENSAHSDSSYEIACPVCLDSLSLMRSKKKQLKSTVCGHIFCAPCIDQAFSLSKCCPSCRKRLTAKQIHPIFI